MTKTLIRLQEDNRFICQRYNKYKNGTGAEEVIRSPGFWSLTRKPEMQDVLKGKEEKIDE